MSIQRIKNTSSLYKCSAQIVNGRADKSKLLKSHKGHNFICRFIIERTEIYQGHNRIELNCFLLDLSLPLLHSKWTRARLE